MIYMFLAAHLVADFLLQPYWLVVRKRRPDGLLIHGTIVLSCMLALALLDPAALALWPAMLLIALVHVAVDWWKVHRADRYLAPPIVPFLLDQVIHVATIMVTLSVLLSPGQAWSLDGAPATQPAIYVGAYIAAALAAPIGVMIWLDPQYRHVALAGPARLRGLVAGAVVLSLMLLCVSLALPATLLGIAALIRRPISSHPLDTPLGTVAVLSVAAALGAALLLLR